MSIFYAAGRLFLKKTTIQKKCFCVVQLHRLCDVGENLQDAVQGLVQTVTHT